MINYDDDEIYTIELDDSVQTDYYEPEERYEDIEAYDLPREEVIPEKDKPFELVVHSKSLNSDEKRKEFLRLRDSISRMNRGPVQNHFLKQAHEYVNLESEQTDFVPFSCYWPTYEAMSKAQLEYYFFWRGRVRKGVFLKTDLSYIFVYIYELINNVGIDNGSDGFLKLCSIWNGYREIYRALDKYLSLWIQDYYIINCKEGLTDGGFETLKNLSVMNMLPDQILSDYMLGSESAASIEYLSRFSGYNFTNSKFYQSGHRELFNEYISAVLYEVNRFLTIKTGSGIFKTYLPSSVKGHKRMPYQNAVYQGKVNSIGIEIIDFTKNRPLRQFIASVIKQLENVLREQTGYKGKLNAIELSDELKLHIRKYVLEKLNREKAEKMADIKVDKNKIIQLTKDSDILREKLISGSGQSFDDEELNLFTPTENEKPEAGITVEEAEINTDQITRENISSVMKPRLTECQQEILKFITEKECGVSETELAEAFKGIFTETELDGINDAAIETIGDIIFVIEDGNIVCEI